MIWAALSCCQACEGENYPSCNPPPCPHCPSLMKILQWHDFQKDSHSLTAPFDAWNSRWRTDAFYPIHTYRWTNLSTICCDEWVVRHWYPWRLQEAAPSLFAVCRANGEENRNRPTYTTASRLYPHHAAASADNHSKGCCYPWKKKVWAVFCRRLWLWAQADVASSP